MDRSAGDRARTDAWTTLSAEGARDPLAEWRGDAGDEYILRNPPTEETTREAATVFERILQASGIRREIGSVLEVGANVGINLKGLRRVLGEGARLAAVEPNPTACRWLRQDVALDLATVIEGEAYQIPAGDDAYDLVFTNGVLIHVPPLRLPEAMREIVRVARRYVLASEYFSHVPMEVPYRGRDGMLWKRDFGTAYLEHCPQLTVLGYGFIWQQEFPHFDNLTWWLFSKAGRR